MTLAPAEHKITNSSGGPTQVRHKSVLGLIQGAFSASQGKLRLAALMVVLVTLGFTAVGGYAVLQWRQTVAEAKSSAEHGVLDHTAYDSFVQANGQAIRVYLSGEKQQTDPTMVKYHEQLSKSAVALAFASGHPGRIRQEERTERVGEISGAFTTYTRNVEQALMHRGTPAGVAALGAASTTVAQEMQPPLLQISRITRAEIELSYQDMNRASVIFSSACAATALLLLILMWWLARRSRRVLNLPLFAAFMVLLVAMGVAGTAMFRASQSANTVAATSMVNVDALSAARSAIFAAQGQSVSQIINPTGVAKSEAQQKDSMKQAMCFLGAKNFPELAQTYRASTDCPFAVVDQTIAETTMSAVAQMVEANTQAKPAMAQLSQEQRFAAALRTDTPVAKTFAAVDQTTGQALAENSQHITDSLNEPSQPLWFAFWVVVAAGLIAMGLGVTGILQRLAEYR